MKKIIIAAITAVSLVGCSQQVDSTSARYAEILCNVGQLKLERVEVDRGSFNEDWIVTAYCDAGVTIILDVKKQERLNQQTSPKKEI